jgi:hypothetical protein
MFGLTAPFAFRPVLSNQTWTFQHTELSLSVKKHQGVPHKLDQGKFRRVSKTC